MEWKQIPCEREIHGTGNQGVLLLRNAMGNWSDYAGQIQMVYLDPPFMTGSEFELRCRVGEKDWRSGKSSLTLKAYQDKFENKELFLAMLRPALLNAWSMLKDTGSLFLHLDWRMTAYARVLCDSLFGDENFVNEIIWAYQTGGRTIKRFSSKHDVLLFYRKSQKQYFDLSQVSVKRSEQRSNHMRRCVDADGRAYRTIRSGNKEYKYYDDEPVYPSDVWTDISALHQRDPQRTGYDTQKPMALLERCIRCTTKPGDWVADLFAGSGTTAATAVQNERCFVTGDIQPLSLSVTRKRLLGKSDMRIEAVTGCAGAMVKIDIFSGIAYHEIELLDYQAPKGSPVTGLDAVDQWSVGFWKDGSFLAEENAARTHQTPVLPRQLRLTQTSGIPAVLIVDIYGNRTVWIEEV